MSNQKQNRSHENHLRVVRSGDTPPAQDKPPVPSGTPQQDALPGLEDVSRDRRTA